MVKQKTWYTSEVKRTTLEGVEAGFETSALAEVYEDLDECVVEANVDEAAGKELKKLQQWPLGRTKPWWL